MSMDPTGAQDPRPADDDPGAEARASLAPRPGGRRRLDHVLAPGFTADLADLPMEQLRAHRREAEQEEVDLSYIRRLLQGRLDILRAELARRASGGAGQPVGSTVEALAGVLADSGARQDHGAGRFLAVEPSRVAEHRRRVEQLVSDVGISDVTERTDEELGAAVARLEAFEEAVSHTRRRVQQVMDACTAEVGRRYKAGEARVEDLLGER